MPSTNVFNELCFKIILPRSKRNCNGGIYCGVLPVMYRSNAYYSTRYSRGIMMAPIARGMPNEIILRLLDSIFLRFYRI